MMFQWVCWPLALGALLELAAANVGSDSPELSLSPPACWVYTDMNKAGGTSIRRMIKDYAAATNTTVGEFTHTQYNAGDRGVQQILDRRPSLIWGAYTEGLRPYATVLGCKWFTMVRHPIARLVSAFNYCGIVPSDQLCATRIHKPEDGDIYDFAEHWGNHGVVQFALAFEDLNDILVTEVKSPPWYKAKLYFEGRLGPSGKTSTSANISTKDVCQNVWMPEILQPVEELLRSKYAAVGILEQWETSMMLFDHALQLPGFNWTSTSASSTPRNVHDSKAKNDLLVASMTDPVLKQILWLDILLYEHACSVHKAQLSRYGLA
ncbi:unnamed protein product [Ectocarpus sp. CCAP 1310/34]|nr:unnamed protein product [Ectocarpus sp. CCAP 1310/34]